jgi:hypothetical protein
MAPELDEKNTITPNPDNKEWYDSTLEDIQNLAETEEPAREKDNSNSPPEDEPTLSERELNPNNEQESAVPPEEQNIKNSVSLPNKKSSSFKKKILIFGSIGVGLSIFGAVAFLPSLLLGTITDKLSDAFFDKAKYAVESRAERYVALYVTDVIGGSMRTCGTTISKDCVSLAPDSRSSLFGKLAANWRDNRIEEKLFRKHGLEFRLNTNNPNVIQVIKNGEDLGEFGRRSATREVVRSINAETKFEGILERRHIRSVMAAKYGASKFCFIACAQRDAIDDSRVRGMQKIKLKMIARVAEIASARTTAYMLCLTTGCSPEELERNDKELVDRIRNQTDEELIEKIRTDIDTYRARNLSELVVRKSLAAILERAGIQGGARIASSVVPIAGQIYLAATILELTASLDDAIQNRSLSNFSREIRSQEAALYATQLTTMSEDTRSLEASIEDSLGAFQFMSGFASSRLWQSINSGTPTSAVQCENDVVLKEPTDPLVCPEVTVRNSLAIEEFRNNSIVNTALSLFDTYTSCFGIGFLPDGPCPDQAKPRYWISNALDIINGVVGTVVGGALDFILGLPLINEVSTSFQNFVANYAEDFFGWLTEKVFPLALNYDADGQLAFDQAAMGFDVIGNSFVRGDPDNPNMSGLGGVVVSPEQQAELNLAIRERRKDVLAEKNIFARLLDIKDSQSLASNIALASLSGFAPKNTASTIHGSIANLPNDLLSSLLGTNKAAASLENYDRGSIFSVTQYAYPVDSPALTMDPRELTPEKCQEFAIARAESEFINPSTGETDYTVENPCTLDEVVVDSMTKIYDLDAPGTGSSYFVDSSTSPNGSTISCKGQQRTVIRRNQGGTTFADWSGIPDSGTIGTGTDGTPIKVYIREACNPANAKTIFIGASIHGSENGGQFVAHELLFNADLPENIRIVAVPEINKFGINFRAQNGTGGRVNANGVNLNRNFNYNWNTIPSGEGNDNYKGTGPESEPEAKALADYVRSLGRIGLALHYHDNLNYVAASGGDTPLNYAITYASFASDTPLRLAEGGRVYQRGSLDGWQAEATGTPTLLIEMGDNQSDTIIQGHVQAVIALAKQGL